MELTGKISQANGRLKAASVGVVIQQLGDRLYLRATLPPKPGIQGEPKQQRISLGLRANPAGLKLAEAEARKIGALLDCREFSWEPYLKQTPANPETASQWIARFELDYFNRNKRTPQSELTWKTDYHNVFKHLPDQPITAELLLGLIAKTEPDTRTRKRYVIALSALTKFAGLEVDLKPLIGSYSPKQVSPRDVPSDDLIAECYYRLSPGSWRWAYAAIAVYGLRNHEIFYLNLDRFPIAEIIEKAGARSKTGPRRIWPIYPEWADAWSVKEMLVPNCTGPNNGELGHRVQVAFNRMGIPFNPYDLRHAWAIRSISFGLLSELAAAQMGHSLQVHNSIYHRWIGDEVHQRHFEILCQRSDRPSP
ncbi:integrase, partial [Leptolyngbya sp. 'hensonii']|uniref:integrase n=1 Tax=Leptolyngbya sp. 'hensonii' TaxID=1922337 RepID=UPI00094F9F21